MDKQKFNVNSMRVASPCSVGWESMSGDERMRHCHSCRLDIYNTAEMTQKEVETLIRNREGRLCIRLYRRYDGTVLTKDFRSVSEQFENEPASLSVLSSLHYLALYQFHTAKVRTQKQTLSRQRILS